MLYALKKLGFLDTERPLPEIRSWKHFINLVLTGDERTAGSNHQLLDVVADKLGLERDHPTTQKTMEALEFFLMEEMSQGPIKSSLASIDVFSTLLAQRLRYSAGERDMVAMHHEFTLHSEETGLEVCCRESKEAKEEL